jgi:hypothetical protein
MHWIDHDFLPDIGGTVERFIVNHHGEIDGLVLEYEPDRFELVHLPPHLGPEITAAIKRGDAVRVRGIRPRGADMISAVAIIASDDRLILDNGPGHEIEPKPKRLHEKTKRSEVAGVVRMSLFGPKGELRGALLENGDVIRVVPKEASPCRVITARLTPCSSRRRPRICPRTRRLRRRNWIGSDATAAREGKPCPAKAEEAAWRSAGAEHDG